MIAILKAPPHAVVEDLGFSRGRAFGLPESGAMDPRALQLANLSLGNRPAAAAIEWSLGPLAIRFEARTLLTATGPDQVRLDGVPIESFVGFEAAPGSEVVLTPGRSPVFCCLAVAGGIATEPVFGSRSTYLPGGIGGLSGGRLRQGDRLAAGTPAAPPSREVTRRIREMIGSLYRNRDVPVLRITRGPQWERFDETTRRRFLESVFQVDRASDRAGYRLNGPAVPSRDLATLPSEAACPGAVQVPDNGQPIVLMPDGPTVGGYSKLAVVVRPDLGVLAQCVPGMPVRFREVALEEARAVLRSEALELAALEAGES